MRDINLTPREEQVLAQMIQGLSTNEIAERLNIGSETVSSYRRIMYRKLGARSAAQAVFKAFQLGILNKRTFREIRDEFF